MDSGSLGGAVVSKVPNGAEFEVLRHDVGGLPRPLNKGRPCLADDLAQEHTREEEFDWRSLQRDEARRRIRNRPPVCHATRYDNSDDAGVMGIAFRPPVARLAEQCQRVLL
jgi:hypothetical protein